MTLQERIKALNAKQVYNVELKLYRVNKDQLSVISKLINDSNIETSTKKPTKPHGPKISTEKELEIVEDRKRDMTYDALSKKYHVSVSKISDVLSRHNLTRKWANS